MTTKQRLKDFQEQNIKRSPNQIPLCWCGVPMTFYGFGIYPYECITSDLFPTAAVYYSVDCKHSCWQADLDRLADKPTEWSCNRFDRSVQEALSHE